MARLYSYCLPYDDGAAPNPFWGVCTLVICKPAIRRTALVGDWIVGTGARGAHVTRTQTQDMSGTLIYAMKVSRKLTMREYDVHAQQHLQDKVPAWFHRDWRRRVGDALYAFSGAGATQRPGVHTAANSETDLSGGFALLSDDFCYFGGNAVALPNDLLDIAQNRQGHRVQLNEPYLHAFEAWISGQPRGVHGDPLLRLFDDDIDTAGWCGGCRARDDAQDAEIREAKTT